MASVGHLAIGAAAGRGFAKPKRLVLLMAFFTLLSFLPDVDVIGMHYGIAYGDPLGHRGASHSLLFAGVVGLLSGFLGRFFGIKFWKMALMSILIVASHGFLDAFTDGGKGIAFFWPWNNERIFFPWRFIPVAPIGMGLFSEWGWKVFTREALIFSPFLVYAFFPRFWRW